ncbi:MAG TPA: type II CAAX endopeptidase family protein [Candidatus Dormibacteraeota bacterium]|nr:type II CAAX endopeptidase family protein [Candidatus Dormibacteraeota bacterium]
MAATFPSPRQSAERVASTEGTHRLALIGFFVLTFALSWTIWVPVMTASFGWPGFSLPPAGLLGALMPGVAAIAVTASVGGWAAVRALLRQLTVWRVDVRWYAAAVLLIPAIIGATFVVSSALRGSWLPTPEITFGAVAFMLVLQIPNTLAEELGWRGFALPRMAALTGWLPASLGLGVIWAAWHLPYWISAPNVHLYGAAAIGLFFAMPVAASVFLAWMYRATGSVLLTWLTHLCINVTIAFLPLSSETIGSLWPQGLYTALIVGVGVVAALRLRQAGRSDGVRR